MFHLFFQTYVAIVCYLDVAYVSHTCCKYFIRMLRMFYYGFEVFLQVFQMHVLNVSFVL
jgi:hypothetical protein